MIAVWVSAEKEGHCNNCDGGTDVLKFHIGGLAIRLCPPCAEITAGELNYRLSEQRMLTEETNKCQ